AVRVAPARPARLGRRVAHGRRARARAARSGTAAVAAAAAIAAAVAVGREEIGVRLETAGDQHEPERERVRPHESPGKLELAGPADDRAVATDRGDRRGARAGPEQQVKADAGGDGTRSTDHVAGRAVVAIVAL